MKRYSCSILYRYGETEVNVLLKLAVDNLGFVPKFMDIYFDGMKNPFDDIPYDFDYLNKLLKRRSGTITIKNQIYDEEKREANNWFRFKLNVDSPFGLDTCSLEWSNTEFSFLLLDKKVDSFLNFSSLIYCYLFDQYDASNQSNSRIESFIINYPGHGYKVVKDFMEDDAIDLSEHWGRYLSIRDMTFMAAPFMWFGEEFFKIIPKDNLLKFAGASIVNYSSALLVHIKLFELYDNPEKIDNRERQRKFWKFFDLQKKAEQYEKERPFDFIAWHNSRAARKKKEN